MSKSCSSFNPYTSPSFLNFGTFLLLCLYKISLPQFHEIDHQGRLSFQHSRITLHKWEVGWTKQCLQALCSLSRIWMSKHLRSMPWVLDLMTIRQFLKIYKKSLKTFKLSNKNHVLWLIIHLSSLWYII